MCVTATIVVFKCSNSVMICTLFLSDLAKKIFVVFLYQKRK